MNNNRFVSNNRPGGRHGAASRVVLAVVIGACAAAACGAASAQDTAGRIFGRAPPGETVVALDANTHFQRPDDVNAHGRYVISSLPEGMYTVMLEKNGRPYLEHLNVNVNAGEGTEVDLDCAQDACTRLASRP